MSAPTAAWWHWCGHLNEGDITDTRLCEGCRHDVHLQEARLGEIRRFVLTPRTITDYGLTPIVRPHGYVGPEYRTVTPTHGVQPPGPPDAYFYCRQPLGAEHDIECVCRERYVLVEATILLRLEVPEHWDKDTIEFARNEGSWCASNLNLEPSAGCMCPHMHIRYIGEWDEVAQNG